MGSAAALTYDQAFFSLGGGGGGGREKAFFFSRVSQTEREEGHLIAGYCGTIHRSHVASTILVWGMIESFAKKRTLSLCMYPH